MRRERVHLGWEGFSGSVIGYGHYGRPVLVFPAEAGHAEEFEEHGMVEAVADLIEAGRVKLYCLDSADAYSWSDVGVPTEERAQRHEAFESWVLSHVLPWVSADCGGVGEFAALGCSMGAYHAVNLALRRADLFPFALGMSGNYDPSSWHGWGEPGGATYSNNPLAYVPNLHGEHLDWLRERLTLLLVVGQGDWETQPTRALPSTLALAQALSDKGIRYQLDVWGYDIPHDWTSWRAQLTHHLPRFC